MTDFESLLAALDRNRVEYIVVGGAAALARGSARFTQDLMSFIAARPRTWIGLCRLSRT